MNPPDHPPVTIIADVRACPARLSTINALARLWLDLRGCGFRMTLRGASSQLLSLIQLTGLETAMGIGLDSPPLDHSLIVQVQRSWWTSLGAGE